MCFRFNSRTAEAIGVKFLAQGNNSSRKPWPSITFWLPGRCPGRLLLPPDVTWDPNLALLSKYSLCTWCNATGYLLDTVYLIIYSTIVRSYFSYKVFSLHDMLHEDLKCLFFKFLMETSIKNQLPHNCMPIQNLAIVSWKTCNVHIQHCMQACNNSVHQCSMLLWPMLIQYNINIFICKLQELVVNHSSEYI